MYTITVYFLHLYCTGLIKGCNFIIQGYPKDATLLYRVTQRMQLYYTGLPKRMQLYCTGLPKGYNLIVQGLPKGCNFIVRGYPKDATLLYRVTQRMQLYCTGLPKGCNFIVQGYPKDATVLYRVTQRMQLYRRINLYFLSLSQTLNQFKGTVKEKLKRV